MTGVAVACVAGDDFAADVADTVRVDAADAVSVSVAAAAAVAILVLPLRL